MQDIEKLVLRLRKEMEDAAKVKVVNENASLTIELKGFLSGIEDAYKMGFTEFIGFQNCLNKEPLDDLLRWYASRQTKEELDKFLHEEISFTGEPYVKLFQNDGAEEIIWEGWADGILHIWNQVKDKLDAEQTYFIRGPNFRNKVSTVLKGLRSTRKA